MPGEFRVRILSPEAADERYVLKSDVDQDGPPSVLFVQPTTPDAELGVPYLWVDTSQTGKFTFWVEDGN
jgi:hypothetical protein